MSKNMKEIISVLSLVYFLSVALVCSGIALMGGINVIKLIMFWVFFVSGMIILRAKAIRKYIPLFTYSGKKEVHHEA